MKKVMLFVGLVLSSFAMKAQTSDEIVQKYLKAMGGADKWKKVESMRQSCTASQGGMNFPVSMTQMRPNLSKVEGEMQGNKFIIQSYDGTVAWTQTPWGTMNKATKMTEDETKETAKEQFEDDFIDYKTKGHTVELEGTEEIDGAKCHKLKLKRKVGDEKIYFIDAENFVPLMVRSFVSSGPAKGQASETLMSDYKEVEGLMIAHTMEQKMNGQSQAVIKIDKVELNPKLEKSVFSLPTETAAEPAKKN